MPVKSSGLNLASFAPGLKFGNFPCVPLEFLQVSAARGKKVQAGGCGSCAAGLAVTPCRAVCLLVLDIWASRPGKMALMLFTCLKWD